MIEGNGGLPQGGTSGENIFGLPNTYSHLLYIVQINDFSLEAN